MKSNSQPCVVLFVLAVCGLAGFRLFAEERGAPVFQDNFDATGLFAEQWISQKGEGGVFPVSKDGKVCLKKNGNLRPRCATPLEFVAEVDVTLDVPWGTKLADGKRGWAGMHCEGYTFCVKPDGTSFLVWRLPGKQRSEGKYLKIPDYTPGAPVRLRVVRKSLGEGGVRYKFEVNGRPSGDFISPTPAKTVNSAGVETYPPVSLIGYREDAEFDNFSMCTVRHDDDSPNMLVNSGFEHDQDGVVPPFYNLMGKFNWAKAPAVDYEGRFLKRYAVDREVRHSGRQSLRIRVNDASKELSFRPWQAGTVKGKAGVFSAWMRSDEEGLEVTLNYGAANKWAKTGYRTVKVGREWARYEVVCTNLPAKGVYSVATISVPEPDKHDCTLWVDDLQAELLEVPAGGFKADKTYATPYKPAETDKGRFVRKADDDWKPDPVKVPRLREGVKATLDLDSWRKDALRIDRLWKISEPAKAKTEFLLACDAKNLYVGARNFGENAEMAKLARETEETMKPFSRQGLEILVNPYGGEDYYHFCAVGNGDRTDLFGRDIRWSGTWTSETRVNAAKGSVDYLVTIPFADLADKLMGERWTMNLCRNADNQEWISYAKTKRLGYNLLETWGTFEFPSDVIAPYAKGEGPATKLAEKRAPKLKPWTAFSRLNYYMDEPEARFRVTDDAGKVHEVGYPLAKVPYGTNTVTLTVAGRQVPATIVRRPYRKGAGQVNRFARCLMLNGEKKLFTSLFVGDTKFTKPNPIEKMLDILEAHGIKQACVFAMPMPEYEQNNVDVLDIGERRGFEYLYWGMYWMPNRTFPIPIEKWVENTRNRPNILSQIVIDEPELYAKSDDVYRLLCKMHALLPYTPVQMNNTVMGIPNRYAELNTDVLMLDDYLTNNEGRTVDSIVKQVDIMRTAGAEKGLPMYYFVSGGISALHHRPPTYREQIAQSWGCIAAGCTGVAWYESFPDTEGTWKAMVDVNREAQSIKDAILSEEICGAATADVGLDKVRVLTRRQGAKWTLVTCNIDANPLPSVTFTLPADAPRSGEVEVLFENRTLPIRNGRFTDAYPGHDRHVYVIKEAP